MNTHSKPWLLIIDPQVIFADPSSEWASPEFEQAAQNIAQLASAFGERVLITRWLPTANRSSAWGDYFKAWPFADVSSSHPLYALVPAAQHWSPHQSVDLSTFGKWDERLRSIVGKYPHLVVAGVSTDCCVLSTVLAAADDGAWVDVVTDACAASNAENRAAALHVMGLYSPQLQLVTTAQVLEKIK